MIHGWLRSLNDARSARPLRIDWASAITGGVVVIVAAYVGLVAPARRQLAALERNDFVESSKIVVRKDWMDTKRRDSAAEMANATARIMGAIQAFKPDLVMLGDDNAARFIGGQLLDLPTPVVFWGINGLPLKYGLVESMDAPGRNVTGVWQSGYHKESLDLLKRLVPSANTFAILACDSESSRPNAKMIEQLAQRGSLPLKLVDKVLTNSLDEFKARAVELSKPGQGEAVGAVALQSLGPGGGAGVARRQVGGP